MSEYRHGDIVEAYKPGHGWVEVEVLTHLDGKYAVRHDHALFWTTQLRDIIEYDDLVTQMSTKGRTIDVTGMRERSGVYRLVMFLLRPKVAELWHPESPGMKVTVTRTWIGRLFKPSCFATLGESLKAGIYWKGMNDNPLRRVF